MAAAKAVQDVFGVEPDLTREGCSIPITLTFQEALNKNVLLLPMGRSDDVSLISFPCIASYCLLILSFPLRRVHIRSMKSLTNPTLSMEQNFWALISIK